MYAFTTAHEPEEPVDFKADNAVEIHWRKHPNLHGWMERQMLGRMTPSTA